MSKINYSVDELERTIKEKPEGITIEDLAFLVNHDYTARDLFIIASKLKYSRGIEVIYKKTPFGVVTKYISRHPEDAVCADHYY